MHVVLLGAPGSGKGTQAKRLVDRIQTPHISTGDLLRQAVADGTDLGLQAKAVMERGELVSDDLMLGMLEDRLACDDAANGFILDGYPRNVAQAQALDALMQKLGREIDYAAWVRVSKEELVERIAGRAAEGRADDKAETVRKRLEVYREQTAPVIDYYRDRNVLAEIDGEGTIDEVFSRLVAAVGR